MESHIISLVALVIATTSTLISYMLYRIQNDPEVVVYAESDSNVQTLILLVIKNTGGSPALDVTFSSSRPIPANAFGFEDAPEPPHMESGPISSGIPSLGPGATRIITWGQYGGIYKGIGDDTIDIVARYRSNPHLSLWKREHSTVSRIDIRSFAYTRDADTDWNQKSAQSLDLIATSLQQIRDPLVRFLNHSQSSSDSNEIR